MDKWDRDNEILALWLYDCFCGRGDIQENKQKYIKAAAGICRLKPGSFRMKLSNIAFLEKKNYGKISSGFTTLEGISKQNEAVFKEFFHNKTDLHCKAEIIIASAPHDYFLQKNTLKPLVRSRDAFK